jgi:serine/threonine protein kinase
MINIGSIVSNKCFVLFFFFIKFIIIIIISDRVFNVLSSKPGREVFVVVDISTNSQHILKRFEIDAYSNPQRCEDYIGFWRKCNQQSNFIVSYISHFYEGNNLLVIMEYCSKENVKNMIEQMINNKNYFAETVLFLFIKILKLFCI